MPRPSRTAETMVEKSSSVSTISAADLATSVPFLPMAQPMSAAFRAGASLTPSPVMATTIPRRWKAFTSRTLCSGATRANTGVSKACRARASSVRRSSSGPVITLLSLPAMPTRRAMASAVAPWSPVIITGRMPARLHWATAAFTPGRGGSSMAMRPQNTRPLSISPSSLGRRSTSR